MKRFAFLILAALLAIASSNAEACSCMTPPIEDSYESSSRIFIGKVLSKNEVAGRGGFGHYAVQFQVLKTYKGGHAETQMVRTALHGASCGFPFEVGETYLVWASAPRQEGELQIVTVCSRTTNIRYAQKDLEWLQSRP